MSKCKIEKKENEADVITCDTMGIYLNHDKTVFQKVMTVDVLTNIVKFKIKSGKKGGYIYLNYCPFCGENIDTSDYGIKE